ncbi:MAG: laccase domain-containing protein, partial [Rhodomicrobium sp.]
MRQDARQAAVKKTAGELGFLAGANLEASGIVHGFFLRTGGVSEGVYASLNCGRGSADDRDRVEENRARVAATLGAGQGVLTGPRQA